MDATETSYGSPYPGYSPEIELRRVTRAVFTIHIFNLVIGCVLCADENRWYYAQQSAQRINYSDAIYPNKEEAAIELYLRHYGYPRDSAV